jgi:hypothetical protein
MLRNVRFIELLALLDIERERPILSHLFTTEELTDTRSRFWADGCSSEEQKMAAERASTDEGQKVAKRLQKQFLTR